MLEAVKLAASLSSATIGPPLRNQQTRFILQTTKASYNSYLTVLYLVHYPIFRALVTYKFEYQLCSQKSYNSFHVCTVRKLYHCTFHMPAKYSLCSLFVIQTGILTVLCNILSLLPASNKWNIPYLVLL